MIFFTTTTLFIKRLFFILFLTYSFASFGQGTVLVPGDIMVLQIDEDEQGLSAADNFIFITFVDLVAGTTIYFTDCGVFPGTGTFVDLTAEPSYTTCPEGATRFVAPSAIAAGSIFQFSGDSNPVGSPFSDFTDALIVGPKIDFFTAGDQAIVFQDTDGAGGLDPSQNPTFIFILNADAGNFTFNPAPFYTSPSGGQQNDGSGTSVPTGLTASNSPAGSATAMAVGEGSAEIDNVIFNGTDVVPFRGATTAEKILNAKIAILEPNPGPLGNDESNGLNWFGESNTGQNDPDDMQYFLFEASLINATNTLPVELTSFIGRPKVKTIDLQWVTASEINNDYFKVEKSTNGIDFKELNKIDGRGTTTLETKYNWTDQSPNNGLNYYRLLQVDFNGDKYYSDIIVVEFEADRSEIQVYPNPAIKELNINFPENWENETSIVIYDFYGKIINSFTSSSGSLTVPVDNMPAGFYRLSATNNNKILNASFVKK
ncbi:MAG: T9SS type A sorting domain-containing protein [Saprospiraceae bacterium]